MRTCSRARGALRRRLPVTGHSVVQPGPASRPARLFVVPLGAFSGGAVPTHTLFQEAVSAGRSALPTTHVTSPYSPRSGPRSCPTHAGRGRVLSSGGRPSFDHLPGNGARLRYRRSVGVLEQSRGTGARPVRAASLSSHPTDELHSSAISGPRQPGGGHPDDKGDAEGVQQASRAAAQELDPQGMRHRGHPVVFRVLLPGARRPTRSIQRSTPDGPQSAPSARQRQLLQAGTAAVTRSSGQGP